MYEVDIAGIEEYAYKLTFERKFRRFQAPSYLCKIFTNDNSNATLIHIQNMLGMLKHCLMSFYFVLMGQFYCLR
jgi:hypothetical protein